MLTPQQEVFGWSLDGLMKQLSYQCGIPREGSRVLAGYVFSLHASITALETQVAELKTQIMLLEQASKNTHADPPRNRR